MHTKEVRDLLTRKFDRSESVKLPQYLQAYLKGERKLDDELVAMLSFWLSHLETRLYKTSTVRGVSSYDMKLDRVLLFLEYARENKHKDGALLMASYRFLFPYADLYLKLKKKRIAVGEEEWSVTKRITSVELKDIKVFLSINAQLEEANVKPSSESMYQSWKEYTTKVNKRVPGKVATGNFYAKLEKHKRVFAYLQELERSWSFHSGNVEA